MKKLYRYTFKIPKYLPIDDDLYDISIYVYLIGIVDPSSLISEVKRAENIIESNKDEIIRCFLSATPTDIYRRGVWNYKDWRGNPQIMRAVEVIALNEKS